MKEEGQMKRDQGRRKKKPGRRIKKSRPRHRARRSLLIGRGGCGDWFVVLEVTDVFPHTNIIAGHIFGSAS